MENCYLGPKISGLVARSGLNVGHMSVNLV